jgi:hypothetical protein
MVFFTHHLTELETLLQKLEVDGSVEDQLMSIEFEEYFLNNKIKFAVLADEDVSIFYTLLEVSSIVHYVTDDLVDCTVDDLFLLLFNGDDHIFIFVKEIHSSEADELISSLL